MGLEGMVIKLVKLNELLVIYRKLNEKGGGGVKLRFFFG